jgi:Zn-dependent peptidase ImmA (M78 family)
MEAGALPVPQDVLRRLVTVVSYPVEFFASTDPVLGPGTSEFFHRKRQAMSARLLNKIHAEINVRRMNLARLLRSYELTSDNIPQLDPDEFDGSPAEIARAVRASWQIPRGPVPDLTVAIEDAGGIVIPCDFETPLVDAISRWVPGLPPLFFINRDMPGDRQRLSLGHELGHMVMHRTPKPEMEAEAYEFAAELLMPESDIRPSLDDLSLERLAALKPFWKVSMAALLRRATTLGKVTERKARTLWMQLGKAGLRQREPAEIDVPQEQATLLREIVALHRAEFGYTTEQLGQLVALNEDELRRVFGIEQTAPERRGRLRILTPAETA